MHSHKVSLEAFICILVMRMNVLLRSAFDDISWKSNGSQSVTNENYAFCMPALRI
jgi:hypothetical protein